MDNIKKLQSLIRNEDRFNAVTFTLELLEKGTIDIVTLYQDVLSRLLSEIDCDLSPEECIWKEHVMSSIVRTILESSFPYIIKEANKAQKKNKLVIIACPSEEYHEIGAKMAYDFFLMKGYDAIFIGANTPTDEIVSAVKFAKPDYLAISVTDRYNLIKTRQVIDSVKTVNSELKIIIGGLAFSDQSTRDQINYDYYITNFDSFSKVGD